MQLGYTPGGQRVSLGWAQAQPTWHWQNTMLDGLDVGVVEHSIEVAVIARAVVPVIVSHFAAWHAVMLVDLDGAGTMQTLDEWY
jgi:hypothetical protein